MFQNYGSALDAAAASEAAAAEAVPSGLAARLSTLATGLPAAEKRGDMVIVDGLLSRLELNGRCALVLSDLRLENGRIPLGIAPIQPDDPLELIAVQPQNVVLAPHVPERMGTAWNNLAYAYKRAGKYIEAGAAYEVALEFMAGQQAPTVIHNLVKLCMTMLREGHTDNPDKINARIESLLGHLFQPITSLPEFRGRDCNYGIDFVPGYPSRMIMCGIHNPSDVSPLSTTYSRLFVFDSENVVEVHPEAGTRLQMSAVAIESMKQPRGKAIRESSLSFSGEL
jgi:hypothetical protein